MSPSDSEQSARPGSLFRRTDQVSGLVWAAIGAFIVTQAQPLPYMDEWGPGPGLFPLWLGLILIGLGLLLTFQASLRRQAAGELVIPDKKAVLSILLVILGLFAFNYICESLGFFLTAFLFILAILAFVERRSWRFSLAIAALSTLIFYCIFEIAFRLRLPPGILENFHLSF